jgi:hypothetical protein
MPADLNERFGTDWKVGEQAMASTLRQTARAQSRKATARNDQVLTNAFLRGKIRGRDFRHADHVRVGFALLCRHNFPDTLALYSAALKGIAARAGNPHAYHETITVAFLSLIAELHAARHYADFESFIADNPDLMDKSILRRWYSPERLLSDIARKTFVMPDGNSLWPQPGGKGHVRGA